MERINRLIQPELTERLDQFDKLAVEIGHFLSLPLENRVWPVLKNHRLTLLTDDPHLATQARFQQQTLSKHLSKCLNLQIRGVHIKLISLPLARFAQKNNNFILSDEAAEIMNNIAQGIDDTELQEAVMRLVKTARRMTSSS